MIRLGINQDPFCKRGGGFPAFEEMIRGVAKMELNLFEFCPEYLEQTPDALTPSRRRKALALANDLGIKLAVHASYGSLNICFINEHTRAESIRQLKREIELAHDLECDAITVHPGLPTGLRPWYSRQFFWDMMLASYEELLEFARPLGVTVCCENVDPLFVGRLEHFDTLLTHFDGSDFGITFDFGHHNLIYGDLPVPGRTNAMLDLFRRFGSRVKMLHIHDNRGQRDDHDQLGTGEIDFAAAIPGLAAGGVDAYWSMELTSKRSAVNSAAGLRELAGEAGFQL